MENNENSEQLRVCQDKLDRIQSLIREKEFELATLQEEYARYREHTLDFADEDFVIDIEKQFENEANDATLLQHRFKAIRTLTECKIKCRNVEREMRQLHQDKDGIEEEKKYLNKSTAELYRDMRQLMKDYVSSNTFYTDQIDQLKQENAEQMSKIQRLETELMNLKELVDPVLSAFREGRFQQSREIQVLSTNLVPDKCSPGIILDRETNSVQGMVDKPDGYGYAISSTPLINNTTWLVEINECSSLVVGIIGNQSPATISYPDNTNFAWNSGGNVFLAGVSNKNHGGFDSFTKGDKMVMKFAGSSLQMYHVQKKKSFRIDCVPQKPFYLHIYMYKSGNKVTVRKPTEEELRAATF